jgi:hypothetical protein
MPHAGIILVDEPVKSGIQLRRVAPALGRSPHQRLVALRCAQRQEKISLVRRTKGSHRE